MLSSGVFREAEDAWKTAAEQRDRYFTRHQDWRIGNVPYERCQAQDGAYLME